MRVRARRGLRRGGEGGEGVREEGCQRELGSGIPRPLIASTSGGETKHINPMSQPELRRRGAR